MGLIDQIFPSGMTMLDTSNRLRGLDAACDAFPFWRCVHRHRSIACERHKLLPPVIPHVRRMQMMRALTSMIVNGRV